METCLEVLVADDDGGARSLLTELVYERLGDLAVLEAADGAEALQLALQRRPQIALLDVGMPRLDGIEVALTLRELRPEMHLALQTSDPRAHRKRAHEHRLSLFDKLELDRAVSWVELQARRSARRRVSAAASRG
jgi:CheY-like chemotaxis protein